MSTASSVPWDFDPPQRTQASPSLIRPPALHITAAIMAYGLIVIVVRPQRPAIDHLHFFLNSVGSSSTGEALVTVKLFTRLGYTIETTACDDFATHRARTGYIVRPLSDIPLDSIAVGLILMAGDPDGSCLQAEICDPRGLFEWSEPSAARCLRGPAWAGFGGDDGD